MKYIINENQIEKLALKFLKRRYNLKEYRMEKYPEVIFFMMDDKIWVEYVPEKNIVYFSSQLRNSMEQNLKNDLKDIFSLNNLEIHQIINTWVNNLIGTNFKKMNYVESLPLPIKRYE